MPHSTDRILSRCRASAALPTPSSARRIALEASRQRAAAASRTIGCTRSATDVVPSRARIRGASSCPATRA